jgi:hypothetical protein
MTGMEKHRESSQNNAPSVLGTEDIGTHDIKWVVIRSRLLDGEEIVIVFDHDDVEEAERMEPGKVIYVPAEINELFRTHKDPETLKKIHAIKKKFGGVIVPADSPLGQRLIWDGLWE